MPLFDHVAIYSAESIRLTRDLAEFYRKRQEADLVYMKQLQIDCQEFLAVVHPEPTLTEKEIKKDSETLEAATNNSQVLETLLETNLWKGIIEFMESTIKSTKEIKLLYVNFEENSVSPIYSDLSAMSDESKNFQLRAVDHISKIRNSQILVSKAQSDYDSIRDQLKELAEANSSKQSVQKVRGARNAKKLTTLTEKEVKACQILTECETTRGKVYEKSKKQLYGVYQEILNSEEKRITAIKSLISSYCSAKKMASTFNEWNLGKLTDHIATEKIAEDVDKLKASLITEDIEETVSLKSLGPDVKTVTLAYKKGDYTKGWNELIFALQEKTKKLYGFERKSSQQPAEIIDLRKWQVHPIDDSFFKRPNCIQLVKLPKLDSILPRTPSTEKDYLAINFAFDSSASQRDWLQWLQTCCYCCTKCSKFFELELITENSEQIKRRFSKLDTNPVKILDSIIQKTSEVSLKSAELSNQSSNSSISLILDLSEKTRSEPLPQSSNSISVPSSPDIGLRKLTDNVSTVKAASSSLRMKSSPINRGFPQKPSLIGGLANRSQLISDSSKAPATESAKTYASRSLHLWIIGWRDFAAITKGTSFYCVIVSENVKQAKTNISSADSLLWGEEFHFDYIPPCHQKLRIIIFGTSRTGVGYQEIAYATLKYDSMKHDAKTEEWIPVLPFSSAMSPDGSSTIGIPSIRIASVLLVEQRLPPALQASFLEHVLEPEFTCVKALEEYVGNHREEFAKAFVHTLMAQGCEEDGIFALIDNEVRCCENYKLLFRGNSITTKVVDHYMKVVGLDYLHITLHTIIQNIYNLNESYEVDPNKLALKNQNDKEKIIKKNLKSLLLNVETVTFAIFKSVENFPQELANVFNYLKKCALAKFGAEDVQYTAISGFLFLRFFCPAILSPKLFKLNMEHPSEATARLLTLIAKILQNLSNLTEFKSGNKETYMIPCDTFISSNLPMMKEFIRNISSEGALAKPKRKAQKADLKHNTAIMAKIFSKHIAEFNLKQRKTPNPKITKIMPVLYAVEVAHLSEQFQSKSLPATKHKVETPTPSIKVATLQTAPKSLGSDSSLFSQAERSSLKDFKETPDRIIPTLLSNNSEDNIQALAAELAGGGFSVKKETALNASVTNRSWVAETGGESINSVKVDLAEISDLDIKKSDHDIINGADCQLAEKIYSESVTSVASSGRKSETKSQKEKLDKSANRTSKIASLSTPLLTTDVEYSKSTGFFKKLFTKDDKAPKPVESVTPSPIEVKDKPFSFHRKSKKNTDVSTQSAPSLKSSDLGVPELPTASNEKPEFPTQEGTMDSHLISNGNELIPS